MKHILILISTISLITAIIWFLWIAAPASIYLIVTGTLASIVWDSKNTWYKAVKSVVLPATIGFAILSILLVWVNLALHFDQEPSLSTDIGGVEFSILHLYNVLPSWINLNWWSITAILVFLIYLSKVIPTWKPVTHFLWLQRIMAVIVGSLAVATSFSFFTNDNVAEKLLAYPRKHVTIVYADSRKKELEEIAKYLAWRTTTEALRSLPKEGRDYLVAMVNLTKTIKPTKHDHYARKIFLDCFSNIHTTNENLYSNVGNETAQSASESHQIYNSKLIIRELIEKSCWPLVYKSETLPSILDNPINNEENGSEKFIFEKELLQQPELILKQQFEAEKTAIDLATDEQKSGIEEILNSILGLGNDLAKDIARELIKNIVEIESSSLLVIAEKFLGTVMDKHFEKITEAVVKKYATDLQVALYPKNLKPDSAVSNAEFIAHDIAYFYAIDVVNYFVKEANEDLKKPVEAFIGHDQAAQSLKKAKAYAEMFSSFFLEQDGSESQNNGILISKASQNIQIIESRLKREKSEINDFIKNINKNADIYRRIQKKEGNIIRGRK